MTRARSPVLIGVVSDIHCSATNLARALDMMAVDGVSEIWCAGDMVLQYRFSRDVLDLLRGRQVRAVRGNHDAEFLRSPLAARLEAEPADAGALGWLRACPYVQQETVGGARLYMTHASPWEPFQQYLRPGHPMWRRVPELDADVVLTGHTHEPMVERHADTLVVNPGSVGEPRQRPDRVPTYAVLDPSGRTAEIRSIPSA